MCFPVNAKFLRTPIFIERLVAASVNLTIHPDQPQASPGTFECSWLRLETPNQKK